MDYTGKIVAASSVRSGEGQKGKWVAQDFVAENNEGRYPTKLVFTVWGEDNIKNYNLQIGDEVTVSFDPNATERDGRWFPSNRAYKVTKS